MLSSIVHIFFKFFLCCFTCVIVPHAQSIRIQRSYSECKQDTRSDCILNGCVIVKVSYTAINELF
jgi:hypothetical protein